jgi:hypothetical protein
LLLRSGRAGGLLPMVAIEKMVPVATDSTAEAERVKGGTQCRLRTVISMSSTASYA